MSNDTITTTLTKAQFFEKKGKIVPNGESRPAVYLPKRWHEAYDNKFSYISQIGKRSVRKEDSCQFLMDFLSKAPDNLQIGLRHATRFCTGCKYPSWNFVSHERQGHATCKRCGVCQKLAQNKFSLRLTDDGVANKGQWEHTPGMTHRDCVLMNKKGKRLEIAGQKPKSHLRNYWRIRGKIEGIAQPWIFMAIESIIKSAKAKLKRFYYSIHNDEIVCDDEGKLPHGGAALAAACFYCAVLEFEKRVSYKTQCTLPAIQESAQGARDQKNGRKCRDVTDAKILRYSSLLKRYGLCNVIIPQIGAETLRFHPKSAALEHARMAIFNECHPVRFHLPTSEAWGISVGDTNQGVLYIERCTTTSAAWKQGVRKGDYIFQMEKETLDIKFTPNKFAKRIENLRQRLVDKPVIELTIMRKKKN